MAMADEKYKLTSLALFPNHYIAHPALPGIGNVSGSADFIIGSTVGNKKPSEEDCQPDKMSLLVVVSMTAEENQYNDLHALFLSQLFTVQYLNRSALYAYELCLLSRPGSHAQAGIFTDGITWNLYVSYEIESQNILYKLSLRDSQCDNSGKDRILGTSP